MDDVEEKSTQKLDEEKAKLQEKIKNLSKIIDMMSAKAAEASGEEPSAQPLPTGAAGENLKENFQELKKSIASLETKIKSRRKKAKLPEEIKNIITTMQDKVTALDNLPEMVESIKKIEEELKKSSAEMSQGNIFGGFGQQEQGGGSSLYVTEIKTGFDKFRIDTNGKIDEIQNRLNAIEVNLDTKALGGIDKLGITKEELLNNYIPMKVKEEVNKIFTTITTNMTNITQQVKALIIETERMNSKIELSMKLIEKITGKPVPNTTLPPTKPPQQPPAQAKPPPQA
jgi:hypothetical protein